MEIKPLVSICCITYNHKNYIRECLEGFIMQKTTFHIEIVISDDCSKDSTHTIIEEYKVLYPNWVIDISPDHNLGSVCNFQRALSKCRGKYIALCEGDDYWTDPLKLQKQVDLLEANPDCMLAYHAFKYHFENSAEKSDCIKYVEPEYKGRDIFKGVQFQTATTMYRREVIESALYKKLCSMGFSFGDVLLFLSASEMGRLLGINEVMSVYRIQSQGASAQVLAKVESRMRSLELWIDAYNLFGKENRKALLEITIMPGVAAALFNLVLFKHISFSRWWKAYISVCKIQPFSSILIPYLFFKHIFTLFGNKIKRTK